MSSKQKLTGEARLAHLAATDGLMVFDPLLSAVEVKGRYQHYVDGYKLWPNPEAVDRAPQRLMAIGNSTSLWPGHNWSMQVGEALWASGHEVGLIHGAGKGSTSSQEVLRVLRDAPAIKPTVIASLSGVCDIGYLLNTMDHPYLHKYTRRMLDYALHYKLAEEVVYGYPDSATPAEVWCRNQRMARTLAEFQGIRHLVFLQPTMGYGAYPMSAEDTAIFESKASVVLKSANKPYGDCVVEFYDEVRAIMAADPAAHDHIIDFVDVLSECPGAYRDHRHQNDVGVAYLAQAMLPHIKAALTDKKPRQGGGKAKAAAPPGDV